MKKIKDDYFLIMKYNTGKNFYDLILEPLNNRMNSSQNFFVSKVLEYIY